MWIGTVKIWDRRQPEKEVITFKSESSPDIWAVSYGKGKMNDIMMKSKLSFKRRIIKGKCHCCSWI
jgi:hypothetical protein